MYSNKTSVNFSGGEVSRHVSARTDLPLANKVMAHLRNWLVLPQGPAMYRPGLRYVHHTRNNNPARFIEFQFSDSQAYIVEVTEGYFRFYKDEALILSTTTKTITGITQASPGVVTSAAHGYSNGDEVYIDGVVGMTELNGRYFIVANKAANTFELTDVFGNNIDTSGYTAYSSGGSINKVYEIKSPYLEDEIEALQYAQNADTMYITHRNYEPRKLTRSGHASWTLGTYTRTNDPVRPASAENVGWDDISAITQANPGVLTLGGVNNFAVGDHVYIDGIVGMTELNKAHYTVATNAGATITLYYYGTTTLVNTTTYTAYSSGGLVEVVGYGHAPGAVTFTDDARLALGGSIRNPETIWFSRGPSAAGAVQFDDYTTGSADSDAITFTLAPLKGRVDSILWMTNTDKYLAVGTFGSVRRIYGSTEQASVTPTDANAKGTNAEGVEAVSPVVDTSALFYIQRGRFGLESIEYDYQIDGYSPDDKNLVSQHLSVAGLKQLCRQVGRPTIIWVCRNDGVLLGLTYKGKENIAGWHQHHLGGGADVEWVNVMPRPDNKDQLWAIEKRVVDGNTVRYVCFMTDTPDYPDPTDYFTGEANQTADLEAFHNYQFELRKSACHLDCSATYDGSVYGTDASATLTAGSGADVAATTGVTFTASASVFTSAMVGRELWGKYAADGTSGGRATITGYTSGTVVTCTIDEAFAAGAAFDPGDWFLTATEISGLWHLEGETVSVVVDGVVVAQETVSEGTLTADTAGSVIHVGYAYNALAVTLPLDQGGASGPAQNKIKNVDRVALRLLNSVGVKYGTDAYLLHQSYPEATELTDRPDALFTGVVEQPYDDSYARDKMLYILQDTPRPATLLAMDIFTDTTDE